METLNDIMREMRDRADRGVNLSSPRHTQQAYIYIGNLADRIEAAITPTIIAAQAKVMCRDGVPMERFNGVVMELTQSREDIAKLRAALEPVLECHEEDKAFGLDNALMAVRKAKDVYNGGGGAR